MKIGAGKNFPPNSGVANFLGPWVSQKWVVARPEHTGVSQTQHFLGRRCGLAGCWNIFIVWWCWRICSMGCAELLMSLNSTSLGKRIWDVGSYTAILWKLRGDSCIGHCDLNCARAGPWVVVKACSATLAIVWYWYWLIGGWFGVRIPRLRKMPEVANVVLTTEELVAFVLLSR